MYLHSVIITLLSLLLSLVSLLSYCKYELNIRFFFYTLLCQYILLIHFLLLKHLDTNV